MYVIRCYVDYVKYMSFNRNRHRKYNVQYTEYAIFYI